MLKVRANDRLSPPSAAGNPMAVFAFGDPIRGSRELLKRTHESARQKESGKNSARAKQNQDKGLVRFVHIPH